MKALVCMAILGLSTAFPGHVAASETEKALPQPVQFHLSGQPLASALIAFSRQSGLQLIIASSIDPSLIVSPVEGDYDPLVLLQQLLAGSKLQYELSDKHTVIIRQQAVQTQKIKSIEEVLVTARRRSQRPEDVSVALTVFDDSDIETLGIVRPEKLAAQVPSMTVKSPYATSNPVFSIRGVGYNSFTSNMSGAIGLYLDDFYLNSSSLLGFDLYDVEQVEVLRGPQGTLFGRNTVGGAISVVTRRPRQAFDAFMNVDMGDYQYSAIQGAIGGGVSETLSARVSFSQRRQDKGFYENNLSGNHGEVSVNSWRAAFLWEPEESLNLYLKLYDLKERSEQWHYEVFGTQDPNVSSNDPVLGEVFQQPCQAWLQDNISALKNTCVNLKGYRDTDNDAYRGNFSLDPVMESDTQGAVIHVNWQLAFAELQSVTGYQQFDKKMQEEFDGSPFLMGDNELKDDIRSLSQEFRLVSQADGPVDWILGAIYSDESVDASVLSTGKDRWGTDIFVDYRQDTRSQAIFAHLEWQLTSKWKALIGARYSYDKIKFSGTTENPDPYNNGTVTVVTVPVGPGVVTETDSGISYGAWSGKLGVDYSAGNGWLWYAHVSRAYKSGGYTGYWIILPEDGEAYDEETLTAYEFGVKWQLPDRHLVASTAVYYYDYRNLQQIASNPAGTFLIDNVGDIRSKGLESELNWKPVESVSVNVGFSYIDARYSDNQSEGSRGVSGGVPVNTPEWSLNTAIAYTVPLTQGAQLTFAVDAAYQDKVYFAVDNREAESMPSYWLYNGRISLSGAGHAWVASLWGRNLGNKEYILEAFSSVSSGSLMRVVGAPRTLGVSVSYSWQ